MSQRGIQREWKGKFRRAAVRPAMLCGLEAHMEERNEGKKEERRKRKYKTRGVAGGARKTL